MGRALITVSLVVLCIGLYGAIYISDATPTDMDKILTWDGDLLAGNRQDGVLTLYSIADKQNPVVISTVPEIVDCDSAVIDGEYLYALDMSGQISIVNIQNPEIPEIVQVIDIGEHSYAVSLFLFEVHNGHLCYVYRPSGYSPRWLSWDVSDPTQPLLNGFSVISGDTKAIALYNNMAYVLEGYTISAYNMSQQGLSYSHTIGLDYNTIDLFIANDILYTSCGGSLTTFDFSSNENPVELMQISVYGGTIHLVDDMIVIGRFNNNIIPYSIVNVEDSTNPQVIGSFVGPTKQCFLDRENIFMPIEGYWTCFDYSDPQTDGLIRDIGGLTTFPESNCTFKVMEDYLIAIYGNSTLGRVRIFSLEDPSNPTSIRELNVYPITDALIDNDHLFYTSYYDGEGAIFIYDVSNHSNFVNIATYCNSFFNNMKELAIHGDYLYCTHDDKLGIIFINNLDNPLLHSHLDNFGPNDHILIDDDTMLLWNENDGLNIFSLTNVVIPVFQASLQPGTINDVAISGTTLIVVCDSHVDLYDVNDPANPILLSSITMNNGCNFGTCLPDGDKLIIADNLWYRILTYDISNPQEPVLEESYRWSRPTHTMQKKDDCLYVCSGYPIIDVFSLSAVDTDPQDIVRPDISAGNFPNPFNPSTTIWMDLPQEGHTELTIYNIKGQRVRTLVNERLEAGNHQIAWDGMDDTDTSMPSGIYLYRIRCNKHDITNKMILMK